VRQAKFWPESANNPGVGQFFAYQVSDIRVDRQKILQIFYTEMANVVAAKFQPCNGSVALVVMHNNR
jgi:hypothetical protein